MQIIQGISFIKNEAFGFILIYQHHMSDRTYGVDIFDDKLDKAAASPNAWHWGIRAANEQ